MVFVGSDGNVLEKRSIWRLSIITDIIYGTIDFIGLFIRSLSASPDRLRNDRSSSTYAQRQGFRRPGGHSSSSRSNIRGVSDLGTANAMAGGG
mmetsp:Transcript_7143/g.8213  ORF Transcript_7143/g.8213 Transcript_7143/m.8213 type:complete len:93 (-) Transcript_7143:347-625(-)|eukprot:CAMPEP_0171313832 /NCGR_PEP_ID=MMETSP0816-20121228/46059_1 /TAXON_ID=420281 /ORGANISM="Proboscia inermis, Strain CCAP1064/1" /LENGTH=92 /DNA_ID=CAMNT_0011801841 /DNA_START=53 /DNA_END=331 /DNA_ORIENTATION=+